MTAAIPPEWIDKAAQARERLREDPAHYFDCDRLQVYDYGSRYGTCDCTHAEDVALAVADDLRPTVDREALVWHFLRRTFGEDGKGFDEFSYIHRSNGLDPATTCQDGVCRGARVEADRLIRSGIVEDAVVVAARTRREVAEEIAQAIDDEFTAEMDRLGASRVRNSPMLNNWVYGVREGARIARAAADQDEATP